MSPKEVFSRFEKLGITIYKHLIRPILFALEEERAHSFALAALEVFQKFPGNLFLESFLGLEDPKLRVKVLGIEFAGPVGLAAGFDKDGKHIPALSALGFGFLEIGTVTFHPQTGNPKPRLRRIPEAQALWNRLGFNNEGAAALASRLERLRRRKIPVGINLGKSGIVSMDKAPEDYPAGFEKLYPYGDYFVINVSSPNTPGLRELQNKERLAPLLSEIQNKNPARKPVLLKISPDLDFHDLDLILEVSLQHEIAGVIAVNTTESRNEIPDKIFLPEGGGISGSPLFYRSTEMIRHIYRQVGQRLAIIGCGGIFSAEDAWMKITAGASLIQIYTGLIYEGPFLVKRIKGGLLRLLEKQGFRSIQEAVGIACRTGEL